MKVRLSYEEVIQACAEFAAKHTDYKTLEDAISDTGYFIIKNSNDERIEFETVEFEYEARL